GQDDAGPPDPWPRTAAAGKRAAAGRGTGTSDEALADRLPRAACPARDRSAGDSSRGRDGRTNDRQGAVPAARRGRPSRRRRGDPTRGVDAARDEAAVAAVGWPAAASIH